jgi:heptosyltransferase-2
MTNIGDVVLSCPVIDILRRDFPQAKMDVVAGPKAVSLFENNPDLGVKAFDKRAPLRQKYAWFLDLYRQHYDCVVDLRHTMLPILLHPKYSTPVLKGIIPAHKKDIHLNRLRQLYDYDVPSPEKYAIQTTKEDELFFDEASAAFLKGASFVVIAPGAADSAKRWHPEGFAAVADQLSASTKVILVGDKKDIDIVDDIQGRMKASSLSLAGKINLRQLAFILKKCSWAMTHDSGVMHLACYFNVPVVALWGPTDINRYGPWSNRSVVVRRNEQCVRCQDPKRKDLHNCMSFIEVADVLNAVKQIK